MISKILTTLTILALLIIGSLLLFDQSRSFYCITGNKCITVWKRLGGTSYIILGRYKGLFKPKDSYIETSTRYNFTIYFSDEIPNSWVVKREQPQKEGDMVLYNLDKNKIAFIDYDKEPELYHEIFYTPDAKFHKEVKGNVDFITINIKENYASNKMGKLKSE